MVEVETTEEDSTQKNLRRKDYPGRVSFRWHFDEYTRVVVIDGKVEG